MSVQTLALLTFPILILKGLCPTLSPVMTVRNPFYPWPGSPPLPSSSWLRNERKNRWKEPPFLITGTHRALREMLTPSWNPSCLTIVSFVHLYPSYRKLKRKVFRAITISDLTENLNYNSVLHTFHFNTHIIFSTCRNEPLSAVNDPWLHPKGL